MNNYFSSPQTLHGKKRTSNIFGGVGVLQDILSEREEMYYELVSQFKTLPSLHNSIKIQRLDSLPKKHKIIYFWLCIVPLMFLVWLARDKLFERINLIMYKFYHNSAINCGRSI